MIGLEITGRRKLVETIKESLSGIALFQGLPPGDLDALGKRCQWRRYAANRQIVGQQDETMDVFL